MFGGIGMPELIVISIMALIIFGGAKIPEIGTGLGQAIKSFKDASKEPPTEIAQSKGDDKQKIEDIT